LIAAAATLINTSPLPGLGVGRLPGTRFSGPPGVFSSIAVMVAGTVLMASRKA
jgi:hypothetical protein